MKLIDVVQNTPEWEKARLGIATASCFDQIITPARGDFSTQAHGYANRLVAERLTGEPIQDFKGNFFTERGHELEPEAIDAYRVLKDGIDVSHGCFCTNDAGTYGASPDNFAGLDGLLEIKCLMAHTHVAMLLSTTAKSSREHFPQLQGQLLVTERKWVDIMFYHPKLPALIITVEREEEYIKKLESGLDMLEDMVQEKIAKIGREPVIKKPYVPKTKKAVGVIDEKAALHP